MEYSKPVKELYMKRYLLAIAIIIILNAAYVFVQRNDRRVAAEENKRLYVQIKSVGVIHEYQVDGVNVKLVKGEDNE